MSKTRSSSAGGGGRGGGGQQVQDIKTTTRRENGMKLAAPHNILINGIADTTAAGTGGGGTSFANISQRERAFFAGSIMATPGPRPTATCNSPTVDEERKHSSAGAGAGATACSYVYEGAGSSSRNRQHHRVQEPIPLRTNGDTLVSSRYTDSRTTPIIQMLFYRTFIQANLDKDVIRRLDIEPIFRRLSPQERSFVQDTCEKYLEYLGSSERASIDSHQRALEIAGWEVSENNVDAEFKKVVNQTFDESVTWGSVIGFLGFALGFSIFIHNKGMKRAVISVAEWTKQVIEDDIGRFFIEHNGWVGYSLSVRVCVCVCVIVCVYACIHV